MQSSRHAIAARRYRVFCRPIAPLLLKPSARAPLSPTRLSTLPSSLSSVARELQGAAAIDAVGQLLLLLPQAAARPLLHVVG